MRRSCERRGRCSLSFRAAPWAEAFFPFRVPVAMGPCVAGTTSTREYFGIGGISRPASCRYRWPRRIGKDRADGLALQGDAGALRHRRDHQRHLYQMGCGISGALGVADPGSHRRRRDWRLPAYGDTRGRLDESCRGRRHAREVSRSRSGADRIRRGTISPPPSRRNWPI